MSSISRLRATTLPGVIATSRPTWNASAPTGFFPSTTRRWSSQKFDGTTHEIHPTLLKCGFEHLGVCKQEVCGRDHVEHLTRDERHDVLVMCFDALHARRRAMPPLLREQEAL